MTSRSTESQEHQSTKQPTMVFFSADWCGHCVDFQPAWDTWTRQTSINSLQIKDSDLHKKYNIEGFPTIRMYYSEPKPGSNDWKPFNNQRTVDALNDFVKRNA